MIKSIAKVIFYFVAVVSFTWTATLTYSFVASALPGSPWYVPALSLVVFDIGMLAWLIVFLDYAQGNMQRGLSIVGCVVDFVGVGFMAIAEILLSGQSLAIAPAQLGELAVWAIPIWTVINVGLILGFHLSSPEAVRKIAFQNEEDEIMKQALDKFKQKRVAISSRVADEMGESMLSDLLAGINGNKTETATITAVHPPYTAPKMQPANPDAALLDHLRQLRETEEEAPANPTQPPRR